MSRRKQAKPRSFKPELTRSPANIIQLSTFENALLDIDTKTLTSTVNIVPDEEVLPAFENETLGVSSPFPTPGDTVDSLESEALGTNPGSSCRSETPEDAQNSPAPSSCATPNSLVDLPEAELNFTIGITETTPYPCQFCDKAFAKLSFLKKHEQIHSDLMPFRCEFCSRLFKHKRSRDRHIKLHTGDKKYRCSQCEAAFSRSDHLKIHMKTHDTHKPYQCTICNRGYNTAAALTSHMQNHKRQRSETPTLSTGTNSAKNLETPTEDNYAGFRCMQCGDYFQKQDQLQNHNLSAHGGDISAANICNQGSISSRLPQLPTKLACIYCTKDSFTTMEQLQMHVQTMHSSIVSGELCDFSASYQGQQDATPSPHAMISPPPGLSTAKARCSVDAPFSCDMCTMRFLTVHRLQKHYVTVHSNCDVTAQIDVSAQACQSSPLVCMQCTLPFQTSTALAEHFVMVHAGASPSLTTNSPNSEQIKPTDLSRKSSRSTSHDKKSKRLCTVDDMLPTVEQAALNIAQYEYPRMFLCNQCDAALPDFESFRTHLKSHIEQMGGMRSFLQSGGNVLDTFQLEGLKTNSCICPHCGIACKDFSSCEQHILSHFLATTIEYGCQSCLKMFPKPDDLQKHLMDIHAHHLFRCSLCKEMFDSKVTIQVHFAVKHSNECKIHRCIICPNGVSVFNSEVEFSMHVRTVHGLNSLLTSLQTAKSYCCMFCQQTFRSDLEMQFHLASHSKQFQCPICSETFQIEFLLDRHMQNYHNNARLSNDENSGGDGDKSNRKSLSNSPLVVSCARKLQTSPSRNSQKSTNENNNIRKQHDSSDLNNCDICERNDFTNESELLAHRKLVHHVRNSSKNGVVSLHCAYCNENCKTRTELENHMKSHSQSNSIAGKHKCNICDELCLSAVLLAEHKLTHCKVISGNCCTQCKTNLMNEDQFYCHLVQHSNNNNNNAGNQKKTQVLLPTPCVICRQTLISDVEVRIHSQFHLRKSLQHSEYQCHMCFKMVDIQNVIVSKGTLICSDCFGMPVNAPPRNLYNCNECQLTFDNITALDRHTDLVHTKLYTCIKCQASFENENDIQIHVTSHLITDGNNHECHLCRRLFSSSLKLQAHLIEHTFAGCGGFTCYLCSAVFTGSQGLQAHIIEHGLAARPYDCPQCNLKFFFRAELDNHSYLHLGRGVLSSTDSDVPLISPKAYYISSGKLDVSITDTSKYYSKHIHKKRKSNKTSNCVKCSKCNQEFFDNAEFQTHVRSCAGSTINGLENDQLNIKEEPEDETTVFKKEEYIEVSSPISNKAFHNNDSTPAESNLNHESDALSVHG